MKALKFFIKLIVALAAVAGAIYALATYGDKIVAWCKDLLNRLSGCKCRCGEDCCCEPDFQDAPEEYAEKLPAEEAVVAEETDFEG